MPRRFHALALLVLAYQDATVTANCISDTLSLITCNDTCLVANFTNGGTECAGCIQNQCVELPPAPGSNTNCTVGDLTAYCSISFSDYGCGGKICQEDEYCWDNSQCIPKFYPCNSRQCENNPETVCALDTSSCMSVGDICDGIRTEELNCADETVYTRWTLANDGIATKKTREVCEYPPGTCGEPVPQTGGSSESDSSAPGNTHIWGISAVAVIVGLVNGIMSAVM